MTTIEVKKRLYELIDELPAPEARTLLYELQTRRIRKNRATRTSAKGITAHLPGGVDDFLQRKHDELDAEDERWSRIAGDFEE